MKFAKAVALAATLLACVSPAFAVDDRAPEPTQTYRVIGVEANDVLNAREQPDAAARIVATLPFDADGLIVAGTRMEMGGSVWWQVVTDDGLGWVNARHLASNEEPLWEGEPHPLRCSGTEPFWTLSLGGEEATFQTPAEEDVTWATGPITSAIGLVGRYAARLEHEGEVGHVAAWRNVNYCSDGMSDIGFPYEAMVIAPDGSVYGGCCLRSGR
ncbi:hypothetical protein [Aliihoeflea sp. PC F10.4]